MIAQSTVMLTCEIKGFVLRLLGSGATEEFCIEEGWEGTLGRRRVTPGTVLSMKVG